MINKGASLATVLTATLSVLGISAPAAASCSYNSYYTCDVFTDADFREAVAHANEGPFVFVEVRLHNDLTLSSVVHLDGSISVGLLDHTTFAGSFVGSGSISSVGLSQSTAVNLVMAPPPTGASWYLAFAGGAHSVSLPNGGLFQALGSVNIGYASLGDYCLPCNFGRKFEDQTFDTNGHDVIIQNLSVGETGSLIKLGSGALILRRIDSLPRTIVRAGILELSEAPGAAFGYPAPIFLTLDGGVLRAGASVRLGEGALADRGLVTLGAAGGTFDSNGFTMTLGDLDGPGGFTKRGAGTLVVDGTSRYGGSTIVEAGTLRVARSTALPSTTALSINGAAVVDASGQNITVGSLDGSGSLSIDNGSATVGTNNASTLFAGSITGSGSLVKTGAGTLTLTGPNTYSGGTFVNAGALVGTSASLHGVITNDSLVGFAQTDSGVFTGTISGTGAVVKTGAGTLTFARPQLTTGLTEIAAGQLNVTGLAGSALVDTDATLSGSGTIAGSVTVNGTLTTTRSSDAPALTIGGNLLFGPSARFVIQARETGANLLQVNGRTTIDGTHLTLVGLSSTLPRVSTLPFLTSLGGVTGEFGKVDASVPVDALVTSRGPTSFLILERTDIPLASLATTANARSAGAALDAARATASGDLRAVIREVGALSDPDVNGALAQLGGSAAATALRTGALDAEDVLRSVSDRLVDRRTGVRSDLASPSSGASNGGHGMSVWFRATGRGLSGDAITSDLRLQGGLLGVDQTVANGRWLVGAFGGYDRAALTLDTGMNGLHDRRYRAGAYATTTVGTGYIDAAVAGAVHRFETTRHVTFVATLDPQLGGGPIFGGIDRSSTARYDGRDVTGFVESGIGRTVGRVLLQPFVGLDASRVSSDGFTERGASSIDLVASSATAASLRGAIGIRAARSFDAADGGVFAPRVEVRYLHELLDPTAMVPVAFAEAPTSPFTVTSATYGAHAVAASAGFVVSLSRQLLLSAQYRAVFASVDRTHAITLGVAF